MLLSLGQLPTDRRDFGLICCIWYRLDFCSKLRHYPFSKCIGSAMMVFWLGGFGTHFWQLTPCFLLSRVNWPLWPEAKWSPAANVIHVYYSLPVLLPKNFWMVSYPFTTLTVSTDVNMLIKFAISTDADNESKCSDNPRSCIFTGFHCSHLTVGGETLKQSWNSRGPTGPEWQE